MKKKRKVKEKKKFVELKKKTYGIGVSDVHSQRKKWNYWQHCSKREMCRTFLLFNGV